MPLPHEDDIHIYPPGNYLGSLVRATREMQGLSRDALQTRVEQTFRDLRGLESGRRKPAYSHVLTIWKVLDVDPGEAKRLLDRLKNEDIRTTKVLTDAGQPAEVVATAMRLSFSGKQALIRAIQTGQGETGLNQG